MREHPRVRFYQPGADRREGRTHSWACPRGVTELKMQSVAQTEYAPRLRSCRLRSASRIACVVSFFTLSKRKGLPHLSGSRRLRSSRFRTTTSYCGRGSRTIVAIPNNNKLLRTRIAGGWFVGPEGRQNPSYPVISESYRGVRTCATRAWSRLAPAWVSTSIDSRRLL